MALCSHFFLPSSFSAEHTNWHIQSTCYDNSKQLLHPSLRALPTAEYSHGSCSSQGIRGTAEILGHQLASGRIDHWGRDMGKFPKNGYHCCGPLFDAEESVSGLAASSVLRIDDCNDLSRVEGWMVVVCTAANDLPSLPDTPTLSFPPDLITPTSTVPPYHSSHPIIYWFMTLYWMCLVWEIVMIKVMMSWKSTKVSELGILALQQYDDWRAAIV